MSASATIIQNAIAARLREDGATRAPAGRVVARRTKEMAAEVAAAAAINTGLAMFVLQPLPKSALQDHSAVFFSEADVRVRIIETPAKNDSGVDAYQLADDVAAALHWQHLGFLQGPLQLAPRPLERVEDARFRILDVVFGCAYQVRGTPPAPVEYTPEGRSVMEDLQAAAIAQLAAALDDLPLIGVRDKELGSRVEQAGHPLSAKVMPPLATQAMQDVDVPFYTAAEIRVKITEFPPLNRLEIDAYDVIDTVALALHWQNWGGLLASPLRLAPQPVELAEDPQSLSKRELDVIFHASFGLVPEE